MKHLIFEVKNQTLKRLDSFKPATNSVDYLTATFTFSEDWSGTTKTAKCRTENNAVYTAIIDSKGVCLIPHEALAQDAEKKAFGKQSFYIWLEGVKGTEKITTEEKEIELSLTGEGDELNASNPSPDLFAQYVETVQAATSEAAEKAEEAAASAIASAATMKNDYANALKGYASGAAIRVDDVSPVEHNPVVKVHGKNIIPFPYYNMSGEINGITYTVNNDGSVTAKGTATANAAFYLANELSNINGTVVLSGCPSGGSISASSGGFSLRLNKLVNGVEVTGGADVGNGDEITLNGEETRIYIVVLSGKTVDCTFYPMLSYGTEVTEYTPYIDPTTLTLKKYGKNLVPSLAEGETVTSNGVTFTGKANGGISVKGTPAGISRYALYYGAPLVRSGYITLSLSGDYSNIVPDFQLRDKDENIIKQIQTGTGATINLDNYEGVALWDIAIKRQTDGEDVTGTVCVQLEKGIKATTYEKYTETEYTPEADGTVNGLTTISPTMTLLTEHEGITIECEYNKNINEDVGYIKEKLKTAAESIIEYAKYVAELRTYVPLLGKKILMLGDSIIGNDQTDGVPSFLAEYSGATVYNGGLGGSCMAVRTNGTENLCFDLPNLLAAATSGNWTAQIAQAEVTGKTNVFKYFPSTINMLKNLNFAELDVITLAYGTNDWARAEHTLASVKAALEGAIDTIQTNYPKVRILVITPIWRYFGGNTDGDTETRYGEGFTLKEWSKKIEEIAIDKRISVLNAYENLPLSRNNAATYFDTANTDDGLDHTHLNAEGNKMYAHIINGKLNSIF